MSQTKTQPLGAGDGARFATSLVHGQLGASMGHELMQGVGVASAAAAKATRAKMTERMVKRRVDGVDAGWSSPLSWSYTIAQG
jgi:hypothetical protein